MAITIDELQIEIQAKGAESASGIDKLTTSLGALKSMINKSLVGKLESLSSALDGIKAPITVNMNVKGMEQLRSAVNQAVESVPANTITPAVDGSAAAAMNDIKASTEQAADGFATITSEAKRAKQELKSASNTAGEAGKKLKEVGTSAKQGASGLSKFVSSLKRILMYRVVRSILSTITGAFSEGINNLYQYSAAMNSMDASHAKSTMDGFATTALYVKNSLAAALMPLLNALLPVVNTIANAFVSAANAVNAFLSAIRGGGTYTKAINKATQYADATSGAAGAAKELQRTLMGFDEINRLGNPSSGGSGGGASGLDTNGMFNEFEIPQKVKDFVTWLEEHLTTLKVLGIAIGGALLTWKIGTGLIEAASKYRTLLGGIAIVLGTIMAVLGLVDAWQNGFDWTNLTLSLGGVALLVAGLALTLGTTAAAIGMLVGGVALLVTGLREWITTGQLSTQTFIALEAGILLVGGAIALLCGGWLPLVIAGVAAIALAVYQYWGQISSWVETNVVLPVVGFFQNMINGIIDTINGITGFLNGLLGTSISAKAHVQWTAGIQGYANGGFPSAGSLFVAGERGAEFVGNVGGSTGVVNADQMAQSVASGNAQVVQMLAQLIDVVNSKEFASYLDGKKVSDTVTRYQRQSAKAYG